MKRGFFFGLVAGSIGALFLLSLFSFQERTDAQTLRTVQLHQGWNLLVWTGETEPVDIALSDLVSSNLSLIYGWQPDTGTFTRYVPGRPEISTITHIERDTGYWLLMQQTVIMNVPTASAECPQPSPCPQVTCPTSTPCPTPTACPTSTPCLTGRCPPAPVDNNKCADALYEWAQSYYLSPSAELYIELWCGEWPEMYVKCSSMPISRDKCAQALFDWAQSGFLSPIAEMDVELWC